MQLMERMYGIKFKGVTIKPCMCYINKVISIGAIWMSILIYYKAIRTSFAVLQVTINSWYQFILSY